MKWLNKVFAMDTGFLKYTVVLITVLFLVGCNSATVRFTNRASDSYELFIDDKSHGIVPSGKFIELYVEAGAHEFKAVQTEGYMLYPTQYTKKASVEAGGDLEWSWGNLIIPDK